MSMALWSDVRLLLTCLRGAKSCLYILGHLERTTDHTPRMQTAYGHFAAPNETNV